MYTFFESIIYSFLVAFGIVLGASISAGVGALLNNPPPLKTMLDMADSIKIWAIAAGLGGTFSALEVLEKGLFQGEVRSILKQVVFILPPIWGANMGCRFIYLLKRCGETWSK